MKNISVGINELPVRFLRYDKSYWEEKLKVGYPTINLTFQAFPVKEDFTCFKNRSATGVKL